MDKNNGLSVSEVSRSVLAFSGEMNDIVFFMYFLPNLHCSTVHSNFCQMKAQFLFINFFTSSGTMHCMDLR